MDALATVTCALNNTQLHQNSCNNLSRCQYLRPYDLVASRVHLLFVSPFNIFDFTS